VRVKYMPWAGFCRYFDLWIIAFVSIPLRIPDLSASSAQRAGRGLMTSVREGRAVNQDSQICELLAGDNEFSSYAPRPRRAALSVSIRSDLGGPSPATSYTRRLVRPEGSSPQKPARRSPSRNHEGDPGTAATADSPKQANLTLLEYRARHPFFLERLPPIRVVLARSVPVSDQQCPVYLVGQRFTPRLHTTTRPYPTI
jgi:hypothetical protein